MLEVFNKYGKLEIKGQKGWPENDTLLSSTQGDLTNEIHALLKDMTQRKLSFTELENEASRIKEIKEVQRQFVTGTGSKNWEEVIKREVFIIYNDIAVM